MSRGRSEVAPASIRAQGPEDHAAGNRAVAVSIGHAVREMGAARSVRVLGRVNQEDGFDCPGCAWPEGDHRSIAEFCENGAKAVAWEATRHTVGPEFFDKYSVMELAARSDHWLEAQGRLTTPMHLAPGASHYRPIAWSDALGVIADALRELPDPNRAIFYTSGRTSNEAAFLYQLLARRLGTNNLPDCSNMCHESSGVALTRALGIGKGTVTLADITDHADLVIVVGQNPGTNHPRMLAALERVKRRGGRIVSINPLPEAGLQRFKNPQRIRGIAGRGTSLADLHLPVAIGGDHALFALLNRVLVERERMAGGGVLDRAFLEAHTAGFEDALGAWAALDPVDLLAQTGLAANAVEQLVEETLRARSVTVCWAMGITQQPNGVATIEEIVNYLLLRGNVGRPGAGPCPVRGHSNVQGDRTMGIWEKMPEQFLRALETEFDFPVPRRPGVDAVDAIRLMRDGGADVFVGMGGNFAQATPDTELTHRALRRVDLTVQVSTKLNRSHLVHGRQALILPCLGRTDLDVQEGRVQDVTVEDSMGMVHASRGGVRPSSPDQWSEVAIVCELAQRVFGADDQIPWLRFASDYALIRDRIERVVPGFENFNERVAQSGGFALPNGPRDQRRFDTATGRANFRVSTPRSVDVPPGHLLLQTMRSHDQYNTTIYGLDDRYRGVHGGRRVVFVNAADLTERGLADGDVVDLISIWNDGERRARGFRAIAYPTPQGSAAAYYPETNVLVPLDSTAAESNTPTSKSIVVRLERSP